MPLRPRLFSFLFLLAALNSTPFLLAQGPPQLPPQAQAVLEGELEVQIEDSVQGSRTHHFIRTSNGRFRLELPGEGPGWLSGSRVRARGRLKDAETLELGSGNDLEPMALANSNTLGDQRTIVILVNFQDNPAIPYAWTHASNVTFNTTSAFFSENSHGEAWLSGDVAGWFTLPMNSTACDTNQVSSLADQAAAAAGFNMSVYKRKVYAFPQIGACSWWGLGSVGGNPSRAWVNGTFSLKVVAHELGHNFGDYHSRSSACTSSGCTSSEYGDDADVMGNPTSGHMNAFQKERLGWLNYGDSPAIKSIGTSGSYWIDSYAVNNPASVAPKALKITKSVDGSGKRTWYYVEARTQTGFDAAVTPGVILHTGYEASGREIYQLDMAPTTSTNDWRLDAGQSFTDAVLGLTITTLWADSTGAMIDVQFQSNPCTTGAPSLSVNPSGTVSTTAGTPVAYSVSVTNQDNTACSSSSFSIDGWVPSGWSWSSSPASITLAPGATGASTMTITPSSQATGSNDIQIGAYRSGASSASVVRTVSIATAPPPPPPPPPPSPSATLDVALTTAEERNGFTISVFVTNGSQAVSGASVSFTITDSAGGTRSFNSTTDGAGYAWTNFRPRKKDPTGTYTVTAVATAGPSTGTGVGAFVVK